MLRRHRAEYEVPGKGRYASTWWQLGSRILRHRQRPSTDPEPIPDLSPQEIARRTKQARSGRPWLRLQAQVYAEETECWICHRHVDQSLPGTTHPMARTVDHVHPLWLGGDPLDRANCRLAHRRCNSARNNQLRAARRHRPTYTVDATTL